MHHQSKSSHKWPPVLHAKGYLTGCLVAAYLVTVFSTIFAQPVFASGQVTSEAIEKIASPTEQLIELLAGFTAIRANFVQKESRGDTVQTGSFVLSKPNRFRIESSAPLSQTMVSDGESLWTYDRDLEQIIINSLDTRAAEIPMLLLQPNPENLPPATISAISETNCTAITSLCPSVKTIF